MTEEQIAAMLPMLRRYAGHLTHSGPEAEDLAQEAVLRTLQRLKTGHDINQPEAYLKATLRNLARRPVRRFEPLEDADDPTLAPEAFRRIALMDVQRAFGSLPAPQADLLRELVTNQPGYAELAASRGLPIGTVMSRLSRARTALRAVLDLPADNAVEVLLEDGAD